jgi:monoamine oxidase
MAHHSVIIVGGGLAGLNAANRFHEAGIDFLLLEARDRLGGRILTAGHEGGVSDDGFDLGPAWFWPDMQSAIGGLVERLGLTSFAQNSDGDMLYQRSLRAPPDRHRGMRSEPQSMRVAGGTGTIISALASDLPEDSIHLSARVTHLSLSSEGVEVRFVDAEGTEQCDTAEQVLLAAPPRLLEATISFSPTIEPTTARHWRSTPTWMAPHAKVFAIYDQPFWREAGLSGAANSMVGPLVEIHDATTASGQAALFGFVGVPAANRAAAGSDAIVAAAVKQLASLFGPQAASPLATLYKDWAADPLTATRGDQTPGRHPAILPRPWIDGEWAEYIELAGSETGIGEPGYLAGAVEASERAAVNIASRLGKRATRAAAASVQTMTSKEVHP